MNLTDIVTPNTVITDIRGTKPEILAELAGRAAILTGLDRMVIFRTLLDREAAVRPALALASPCRKPGSRRCACPERFLHNWAARSIFTPWMGGRSTCFSCFWGRRGQ